MRVANAFRQIASGWGPEKMTIINAFVDEEEKDKYVSKIARRREKADMKMLIRAVLETPLSTGKAYTLDDVSSIAELSNLNTDLRTRIILAISREAANGDIKSAEFLFKYGGFTPAIEQNITVQVPNIINDIAESQDDIPALEATVIHIQPPVQEVEPVSEPELKPEPESEPEESDQEQDIDEFESIGDGPIRTSKISLR